MPLFLAELSNKWDSITERREARDCDWATAPSLFWLYSPDCLCGHANGRARCMQRHSSLPAS